MIDIHNERLVALTETPEYLPRRRGKKINVSTVYRWASPRGCRGKRLETCTIGGVRFTSLEAINRFVADEAVKPTPHGLGHAKAIKDLEELLP